MWLLQILPIFILITSEDFGDGTRSLGNCLQKSCLNLLFDCLQFTTEWIRLV